MVHYWVTKASPLHNYNKYMEEGWFGPTKLKGGERAEEGLVLGEGVGLSSFTRQSCST